MSVLKSLSAFTVAAGASVIVSVGWAAGVGTGSAKDQDLPDLGSPATAAVSLDDEYRAGLGWFAQIRQRAGRRRGAAAGARSRDPMAGG